MMIVQIDKMTAPSSRERAQRLYKKTIELERQRQRQSADRAQLPSDPNAWHQMRENYEAIILVDHDFSEQRNVEYALWQLHYKRIEEFRALYNNALASAGSKSSQGLKGSTRPDRLGKIRVQFKTFLAEASGFYHDLIMKVRAKYGLPLGYFSDDSEDQIIAEKDAKKSADMKKGLVSCHRCLIYLGDLARYKGSYGDGDSKNREYAAASSYYLQAASLCPFIGNPHHQLAILASYLGDELVVIYRYFRSLAVDAPFATARDNLILAFEKNRQSCALLPGDVNIISAKSTGRMDGKGRGRMESKAEDTVEVSHKKEERSSVAPDTFKSFCTRFVRINGILFTRTSLETFADILSLVSSELCQLLSSGPEEELTFGTNDIENGLVIVRIVAILIFTVHNVNKQTDNQTYAEIVQRAVLLQNAFTAAFDLVGRMVERCSQLRDPSRSFLLPGILIFVEWLAFHPDLAKGNDVDDNQAAVRTNFWSLCVSLLNKVLSLGPICIEDEEEESCFDNMSNYEEGATENRLALWEDFELRGFLPLVPAHSILNFSRKPSFGGEGDKERKARVKRILAAAKALANVVKVDQKNIFFNVKAKKFVISGDAQMAYDFSPSISSAMPFTDLIQENPPEKEVDAVELKQNQFPEEEDDEVIVFKPLVAENQAYNFSTKWATNGDLEPGQIHSGVDINLQGNSSSFALDSPPQSGPFDGSFHMPVARGNTVPQYQLPAQVRTSKWLVEDAPLATSMRGLQLVENGYLLNSEIPEAVASTSTAPGVPIQQFLGANTALLSGCISKAQEAIVPSKVGLVHSSGVAADNFAMKATPALQTGLRRNPVNRPARHVGPPPGFSHVPPKQVLEPSTLGFMSENPILDDYSWLDGYQVPTSTTGSRHIGTVICDNPNLQQVSNSNSFIGTVSFPFPGKLIPTQGERQNGGQVYQMNELTKAQNDQQLMQQLPYSTGNQHFPSMSEQFQGQSIWSG